MDDSILITIKKLIGGLMKESTDFNIDLITYINSSFSKLNQLGIGPDEGFSIIGSDEVWSDYSDNKIIVDLVKSYVYVNVKLLFDPPGNSFTVEALKSLEQEYSWRLSVLSDEFKKKNVS